jgi:hypothetical protein
MTTNDEIIHKQQRLDRLPKFRYYQEAINLLDEMLNEARADTAKQTAKQILTELDNAIYEWENMDFSEPDNSDYGEHFDTWCRKVDIAKTIQALKKQHKVD